MCLLFHRLSNLDAGNIICLLAPDIGMFLTSLIVTHLCKKMVKHQQKNQPYYGNQDLFSCKDDEEEEEEEEKDEKVVMKMCAFMFLYHLTQSVCRLKKGRKWMWALLDLSQQRPPA